ncbi:MAG TPA: hypothetical protein VKI00_22860 [Mycobacterium sp.]|uniref:hypothetical protein n=1 Tax=Mycobacterium sp. TaxID=1785 RepID=UPI002B9AF114|nr:hypothetical protein [Mycobacterium sp.]HME78385.1 hypothetical protein [Mycobacterium sp.]
MRPLVDKAIFDLEGDPGYDLAALRQDQEAQRQALRDQPPQYDMNSRDAAQREPSYPRELFMRAVVQGIASCIDYDKAPRAAGPPGAQQISAEREKGQ